MASEGRQALWRLLERPENARLSEAAAYGRLAEFTEAHASGADVNTLLIVATVAGYWPGASLALQHGARPRDLAPALEVALMQVFARVACTKMTLSPERFPHMLRALIDAGVRPAAMGAALDAAAGVKIDYWERQLGAMAVLVDAGAAPTADTFAALRNWKAAEALFALPGALAAANADPSGDVLSRCILGMASDRVDRLDDVEAADTLDAMLRAGVRPSRVDALPAAARQAAVEQRVRAMLALLARFQNYMRTPLGDFSREGTPWTVLRRLARAYGAAIMQDARIQASVRELVGEGHLEEAEATQLLHPLAAQQGAGEVAVAGRLPQGFGRVVSQFLGGGGRRRRSRSRSRARGRRSASPAAPASGLRRSARLAGRRA
jgi:hypothetical protein